MQNNDNYSIGEDFNIEVMQYYKYRATKVKPKKKMNLELIYTMKD